MSINVVSFSSSGGAGNVARTLVDGFLKIGLNSRLLTAVSSDLRAKPIDNPLLTLSAARDAYLHKTPSWGSLISLSRDKQSVLDEKLPESELTIFRWMNGLLGDRFVQSHPNLRNLVWGLDDMNPFTGVCHYGGSCRGYESDCSQCPAVRKPFWGKVEANLERKFIFAERYNPTYVAPTDWILGEFQKSRLGNGRSSRKINNPLQSLYFGSQERASSMSNQLRLLIIAANLDDPTKGVWDVMGSLNRILDASNVVLTAVGRYSNKLASHIPLANFMGPLDSGSVLRQIRENDVLLVPSLSEAAGMVIAEAGTQGIPTIAREVGGMPEMTNYGETGYLFNTSQDLDAILDSLSRTELASKGALAKEWAQRLRPELIAAQYAEAFL